MAIPTLDQTEGIWITRTNNSGYHYVQDVFAGENPRDQFHRANCRLLITKGRLIPERGDNLKPAERLWEKAQRYSQVLI